MTGLTLFIYKKKKNKKNKNKKGERKRERERERERERLHAFSYICNPKTYFFAPKKTKKLRTTDSKQKICKASKLHEAVF